MHFHGGQCWLSVVWSGGDAQERMRNNWCIFTAVILVSVDREAAMVSSIRMEGVDQLCLQKRELGL